MKPAAKAPAKVVARFFCEVIRRTSEARREIVCRYWISKHVAASESDDLVEKAESRSSVVLDMENQLDAGEDTGGDRDCRSASAGQERRKWSTRTAGCGVAAQGGAPQCRRGRMIWLALRWNVRSVRITAIGFEAEDQKHEADSLAGAAQAGAEADGDARALRDADCGASQGEGGRSRGPRPSTWWATIRRTRLAG